MSTKQELPTLVDLLETKLNYAGPRDKGVNIKIAINTARMMLTSERRTFAAMREALQGLLAHAPAPSKNVKKEYHYLVAREAAKTALALAEGKAAK